MGYRNWICRIRKDVDLIALQEDYEYRYNQTERVHELGKYVDFEPEVILDLYENQESEGEYAIMEVDEIKKIMEWYASLHLSYLQDMLKEENELTEEEKLNRAISHHDTPINFVEKQILAWSDPKNMVYNDDSNSPEIVKSWNYQYEVFELLHIYKTWDHNHWMVWYGG